MVTYQDYIKKTKQNVYKSKKIKLPRPEMYVVYTGNRKERPEYISLAEKFFDGQNVFLDASETDSKDEEDKMTEQVEIRGYKKSKIYHCPGQASYNEMADSDNLVVFHSEQEALDARNRKAKR